MTKKKSKPEIIITPSGHEVDKDLAKVPIKVSSSLQALMANQMELIEMAEGKLSRNLVFVEQHKLEMLQLEEEIAGAFSNYMAKKEKAREKRMEKQSMADLNEQSQMTGDPGIAAEKEAATHSDDLWLAQAVNDDLTDIPFDIMHTDLERSGAQPAGLPSAKYEARHTDSEPKQDETDVRRIALGASIKALQTFLARELTEAEMQSLEVQVDAYLE
ncbi:MAG TPA: hypothetical protein DEF34_12440 [Desulfotomaculum sp.]|nr:MAG: hypothetical protein VR67_02950 [Peptococcaceae bacterium BRH_c8a]KJS70756.1 MAG: hypothetical protein JL56_16625 [Desulfotomaculum sp. BICA1-6]HBX24422.1 hypothetical protein [Desulfotomaculum sp.]